MRHLPPAGGSLWPQAAVVAVAISEEKIIFYRKKARKSADFLAFTFHGEGRGDKRHLAAVGLRPSRSGKDAFDRYGPIGEKAVPKRPQSFRNCKL